MEHMHKHAHVPFRVHSRRLLYLNSNALSDGGEQRDKHYAEIRGWLPGPLRRVRQDRDVLQVMPAGTVSAASLLPGPAYSSTPWRLAHCRCSSGVLRR
jgi:hypothetical protein